MGEGTYAQMTMIVFILSDKFCGSTFLARPVVSLQKLQEKTDKFSFIFSRLLIMLHIHLRFSSNSQKK